MRYLNRPGINPEAFLKIASLLGFAILFYTVIESGNAQYYVHPRIVPYMQFGIITFIIISLFISDELFRSKRKNIRMGRYLLFIIPLALAFALPPKTLDTDSMSLGSPVSMSKSVEPAAEEELADITQAYSLEEANSRTTVNEEGLSTRKAASNAGLLKQGDTILMTDESFMPWIEELYGSLSKYEGNKIQIVGFVFKDKEFGQDKFVPARLSMNCCAADMQPVGILCSYQGAGQLKKDSWVKVTGKVQRGEFKGQEMPVVMVEAVEAASKPKNEFVY